MISVKKKKLSTPTHPVEIMNRQVKSGSDNEDHVRQSLLRERDKIQEEKNRDSDDDYLSKYFSGWYWITGSGFEFEDEFFISVGEL